MNTPSDLKQTALACVRGGVSILPADHTTKRPAMDLLPQNEETGKPTWKPYQTALADARTIESWFTAGIQSLAVVGGAVSGGLLIFDFDVPRFYPAWVDAVGELANGLPVQQTGGGGYQVFMRCPNPGGNDKLAWAPDETEKTGRTTAIETRGEGGYALVAPSLHPSGNYYRMLSGDLGEIPTVSQARADALLNAARKLDEAPYSRQEQARLEAQARSEHQRRQASRDGRASVIDAFNAAFSIESVLERYGYTRGPRGRYIRPGGESESVSVQDGRACHWSTNDPLNDGKVKAGVGVHDAFDLFVSYGHGGDVAGAVKAAAALPGVLPVVHTASKQTPPAEVKPKAPSILPYVSFPVDALPEPLRRQVEAVSEATGTDHAYAALAALVVVAGCVGNRAAALVRPGWVEPAVLWGALVGKSGSVKTHVLKPMTRPLVELYKAARREFSDAQSEYQRATEHYAVRLNNWKQSHRKGPPTDPPDKPEQPQERRVLVSDITVEKLACVLEANPLGLLLVRDELAGWLGSFDRYAAGGKGSDQPTWLSMYDAGPVNVDRKSNAKPLFVEQAAVSVLGTIQPATLVRVFGVKEREAGLLGRVLLANPPPRPALWTESEMCEATTAQWRDLVMALQAMPAAVDELGDPRPRLIPLSAAAKPIWIEWHNRHVRELADLPDDDLAAHYSKLKGGCVRIALLFACVDVAAGGDGIASIGADHMRRAIQVTEWFKHEARRVYGPLDEDNEQGATRELVEWIHRRGGTVTARDLSRGLRKYREAGAAEAILNQLVGTGLGTWEFAPPKAKGGPSAHVFRLAPPEPEGAGTTTGFDYAALTQPPLATPAPEVTSASALSAHKNFESPEPGEWGGIE